MLNRIAFAVLVGLLVPAAAQNDAAMQEAKKLEGRWMGVLVEHKGKPVGLGKWTLVIKGEKYTLKGPKVNEKEMTEEGTFKLNPTQKPKAVDLTPVNGRGETRLGIYELDGDRATACFAGIGSKNRPKDLATKADGDDYLWKFQRD